MESFQTFILLMFAAAILVGIAQKIQVPYPIALIIGGTAIGFIPFEHAVPFYPNLILVIVLPPLLYYAAFGIQIREFKRNFRMILSLALGLVLFTTLIIGIIFKWLFPDLPWALAFAFGAIVSPPDAIAATTILKRFSIGSRLTTILEGESLINDASALVLYKLALAALFFGTFSFAQGSVEFVKVVSGGILVGFILGYLLQNFSKHYLEPTVGVVFSFTIPYVTYITADSLGVSGVLAVVVNGLFGSQVLIRHCSSLRRILGYVSWDIFNILMNCFVFILIGLQLRSLTKTMSTDQLIKYGLYALLITATMVVVRIIWVFSLNGISYFNALKKPKSSILCPQILREATLIGWSGMRGIVSLAAAMALPLTLSGDIPLKGRDEVIYITFIVILLTLLIPGFTLPALIKWLNIHRHSQHHKIPAVKGKLANVAEEAIQQMRSSKKINDLEYELLQIDLNLQRKTLNVYEPDSKNLDLAKSAIIREKRKKLLELWEKLEIDDWILTQLEHELDLEETHIARAQIK